MLRATPDPVGEVCLSIDVGSQNAGVCLFDAAHQQILYLNTHALLTEHEHFVTSTQDVQHHLNDITALIGTLLHGRDYWVLVEQQYLDQDAKAGLYFNLQLQMLIEMYYLQKGKRVLTVHATKRYPFLGIHGWKQDTRTARKNKVVKVVSRLLDPAEFADNTFAARQHNLADWESRAPSNRRDMADALAQALSFYYRHLSDVLEGNVRLPQTSQHNMQLPQTPHKRPKRQSRQAPVSPRTSLHAKLQQTIDQLQTKYRREFRGISTDANRLLFVHNKSPSDADLSTFMTALNRFDGQGRTPLTEATPLSNRLAYLVPH